MDILNLKTLLINLDVFVDNNYLDKYVELCCLNVNTAKEKYKTNAHHVIPVAYYKIQNNISDRNEAQKMAEKDVNNFKINLYFKDHLLAHYYLAMCSKTLNFSAAMLSAVQFLFGHTELTLADLELSENELMNYQTVYEKSLAEKIKITSRKNIGKKRSEETKLKQSIAAQGRVVSKEAREKMSAAKKGRKLTEEQKRHLSEKMKGRKQPWAGRKQSAEEIEKRHQKLIGHPTSEETRRKISEANKGRKLSEEARQKLSEKLKGRKAWNKGLKANNAGKIQISNISTGELRYIDTADLDNYTKAGWIKGNYFLSLKKKGKSSNTEKSILCLESGLIYKSLKEASSQPGCSCLFRSVKDINITTNKCHWIYLKQLDKWPLTNLKVIGYQEGTNKNANRLGALICDYKGNELYVGGGYSDVDRAEIWDHKDEWIGKMITVKYFEKARNADGELSLRFPIFIEECVDKGADY